MGLADHFERIFIINLPSRKDRRRHVTRELARLGVSLQPGRVELFPAVRPDSAEGFESVGRRGVFLSHAAIARQALREGVSSLLVLEDDVAFTPAMHEHGEPLLRQLAGRPWHIAFLGYLDLDAPPGRRGEMLEGPPAWLPLECPRLGTHCYALKGEVLPALVAYMEGVAQRPPGHPEGGRMGADATFNMFRSLYPQWTTLVARPNLAGQIRSASDLMPRWFDQVPGLREALRLVRSMKGSKGVGAERPR